MNAVSSTKKICICAVCIALCYALPLGFHALALGMAFSPIHIPVLLCGLVCGPFYGTVCGIAGPIVSSLLSGMPPAPQLVSMIPELLVYGLVCGILIQVIHTRRFYLDVYGSMIPAMLLGRIVGGIAKAIFYLYTAKTYSVALWATAYFADTLPGTILQLLLIPTLLFVLMKAKLIPQRKRKEA
ncbi:MAG: ECF transporter S component [Eubacteriales bacterium]|nr:ECF transporter S component [Eubacteriales bacterium]